MATDTKNRGRKAKAGTPGARSGASPTQNISSYLLPTAFTITKADETSLAQYASSTPTEMVSAWDLPQNMGALHLTVGQSITVPATKNLQTSLSRGMAMLQLYGNLVTRKLTAQDIKIAQQFGGTIARAAELMGVSSEVGPVKTADRVVIPGLKGESRAEQRAVADAVKELKTRLQTTIGLTPAKLDLTGRMPKDLASMMQNAGYAVTSHMTLEQAINAMSGVGKTKEIPSPNVNKPLTVAQYIQSLTNGTLSRTDLSKLQAALYTGGFYDPGYYLGQNYTGAKTYTSGQLTGGTILAFRTAILETLTQVRHGKKVTVEQVIQGGSSSTPNSILGATAVGERGIKVSAHAPEANPAELQGTLETAMETYLGRLPTQTELKQFTGYYNKLLATGSALLVEEGENPNGIGYVTYQTGIPYVGKVPTPAQAAEQYSQNQNPVEYHARNIADAYGMLMNLIDRPNASALTTPGSHPLQTS